MKEEEKKATKMGFFICLTLPPPIPETVFGQSCPFVRIAQLLFEIKCPFRRTDNT